MSAINKRQQILDSIYEIYDKGSKTKIDIYDRKLKFYSSKYSSKKNEIWHIELNDTILKKTSDVIISYRCVNCNTTNSVSSTQIIRKINKCSTFCPKCNIINLNSISYDRSVKSNVSEEKPKTLSKIYKDSLIEFETYPNDFKQSYLLSHLSVDDYKRIKPNIIGFCNKNKNKLDDYEFWDIFKTNNQQKFTSVLYDKNNDTIFKADQPVLKCDNCLNTWRAKNIEQFKNAYKILCKDCKLCNRTFKIRSTSNIMGDRIIYQSKLELKFINWCESNGIVVHNGPSIEYFFDDKCLTYRVDFKIDNMLIEIKDFHIWHKNQIESGKWNAKMEGVNKYIEESSKPKIKKYYLLTPNNWNQMLREIKSNTNPLGN
jgi:hypothetical protein